MIKFTLFALALRNCYRMWQTVQIIEADLQADRFLVLLCKVGSETKKIEYLKVGVSERGL